MRWMPLLRAPAQRAAERPSILLAQVASGDGFAFLPLSLTKFAYPGVAFTALPAAVTKASACRWGWRCRRLRGFVPVTQFECFVETARRVAAG